VVLLLPPPNQDLEKIIAQLTCYCTMHTIVVISCTLLHELLLYIISEHCITCHSTGFNITISWVSHVTVNYCSMSGTHQASYLLGTRGSFSMVKGRDRAWSWSMSHLSAKDQCSSAFKVCSRTVLFLYVGIHVINIC